MSSGDDTVRLGVCGVALSGEGRVGWTGGKGAPQCPPPPPERGAGRPPSYPPLETPNCQKPAQSKHSIYPKLAWPEHPGAKGHLVGSPARLLPVSSPTKEKTDPDSGNQALSDGGGGGQGVVGSYLKKKKSQTGSRERGGIDVEAPKYLEKANLHS